MTFAVGTTAGGKVVVSVTSQKALFSTSSEIELMGYRSMFL